MRLVITGASGHLGRRLVQAASLAGHEVFAWTSPHRGSLLGNSKAHYTPVELTIPEQVAEAFWQARPMAIIHAAALSTIADCYRDPVRAFRINAEATRQLVGLCVAGVSRLIYVSTDLVFDGKLGQYREDSFTKPLSIYGKSKLDGERAVLHHPGHLVARVSWLVGRGPADRPTFLDQMIASLQQRQPISLFTDEYRSPLGIDAVAQALISLASRDVSGVLHLGGPERLSRYDMGCILAKLLEVDSGLVTPALQCSIKTPEPRPSDVSLNSNRWRHLMPTSPWPTFAEALRVELALPAARASEAAPGSASPTPDRQR